MMPSVDTTNAYPNGSVAKSGISVLIRETIMESESILLLFLSQDSVHVGSLISVIQYCVALQNEG